MNYPMTRDIGADDTNNMSSKDDLFNMFLDEDFVPQAYVDILLNNIDIDNLNQVHSLSSGLLTKLDFYTTSLTKELEKNVWNLEKLAQSLPGTWSVTDPIENQVYNHNSKDHETEIKSKNDTFPSPVLNEKPVRNIGAFGVSKLEYYLDTLGSSVKSLENDLNKLETDLSQRHKNTQNINQSEKTRCVIQQLKDIKLIKTRLIEVLTVFTTLKDILFISNAGEIKGKEEELSKTFIINDFRVSLSTLRQTIGQTLEKAAQEEDSDVVNKEILSKIEKLVKLTDVFKSFDKFYKEYQEFSKSISQISTKYLELKDIVNEE